MESNYEAEAFSHLQKTERNYHFFKAGLIIIATLFTAGLLAYETSLIVTNTNDNTLRTQKYIRCIILLPASSFQGSIEKRSMAIDNCSLETKIPQVVNK